MSNGAVLQSQLHFTLTLLGSTLLSEIIYTLHIYPLPVSLTLIWLRSLTVGTSGKKS